jgi:hypothetical protein
MIAAKPSGAAVAEADGLSVFSSFGAFITKHDSPPCFLN